MRLPRHAKAAHPPSVRATSVSVDHYENFPVASWLVPGRLRGAIVAIYAFARGADDIADEGDDPAIARLAALDRYAAMLDRIELGDTPAEAPFDSLAREVRAHGLPLAPLRDLLSAFRQDVVKQRYADFADLADYCSRSANPVGRLLLHLYGVDDDSARAQSDAICTGLQLANFWQDVAIDWNKGRIYLPQDDLRRFGVEEAQIDAARCDEGWTQLMAFEVRRTRELFEFGQPLTRRLPLRLKLELNMVVAGGLRILRSIDASRGDVFRQRPVLRRRDWAAMSVAALRR
jgi:squalene synthase HpnC